MALVVYTGPSTEGRYVQITADHEVFAPHGIPVELPDDLAARLCEQSGWSPHKAKKSGDAGDPKE